MIYCPTDKHTGDYNSKPLQGKLWFDHRNTIMGICEEDFGYYKQLHIQALKQYDLYEDEDDLHDI